MSKNEYFCISTLQDMRFNIIKIQELNSTNSYAQQQIENDALQEGDVIFTMCQNDGKGQGKNSWESEPGSNLMISIVLEPNMIYASQQFVLTQLVSLAIIDIIKKHVLGSNNKQEVKIKWPNDIYVGNNKIAGILFQNFIKGNTLEYSIVGVGINVNQKEFFSSAPNPISIIHFVNKLTDVNELLNELLFNVGTNYEKYTFESNFTELKLKYLKNLYKHNIWADYTDSEGIFKGKIIDIDEFGRLIVEQKDGNKKQYMYKEIQFNLPNSATKYEN